MQTVIGILLLALGFSVTYYANWLYNNLGPVAFFEKWGGSRLWYKFIGIFVFFLGALTTFNLIGPFLFWLFKPVIKMMYPQLNDMDV
ncbi:MAG: hypothetical protein BWY51_00233 [Parcubacteria group bacterium ADurb.Bin316]|nr:MAG: hypothetical protein BWY51_00233 [Parcubacteria group bacterium ADurb.Bin316]HOZ55681.1 hypothetical protein [bacterium]